GDGAGELEAEDLVFPAPARVGVGTSTLERVGTVAGAVGDGDEDLVGTRLRVGELGAAAHLRPAVLRHPHRPHPAPPSSRLPARATTCPAWSGCWACAAASSAARRADTPSGSRNTSRR